MKRSKRRWILTLMVIAFVGATIPSVGRAQMMIDMSRITCAQYLALPADQSRVISAWMSGWFNQKTGYVWINLNAYAKNVENVKAWCAANSEELLMTALERATGTK